MNIYQSILVFENDQEITVYCGDNFERSKFLLEEGLFSFPKYNDIKYSLEDYLKHKRIDIWLDGSYIGTNIIYNSNDYK